MFQVLWDLWDVRSHRQVNSYRRFGVSPFESTVTNYESTQRTHPRIFEYSLNPSWAPQISQMLLRTYWFVSHRWKEIRARDLRSANAYRMNAKNVTQQIAGRLIVETHAAFERSNISAGSWNFLGYKHTLRIHFTWRSMYTGYWCARHGGTLGNGSTAPPILYHATRRKRVLSFTLRSFFDQENSAVSFRKSSSSSSSSGGGRGSGGGSGGGSGDGSGSGSKNDTGVHNRSKNLRTTSKF